MSTNHNKTTVDNLDELLNALDEADAALRAAYRELAEDPDRRNQPALDIGKLNSERLELAQQVGLAALARRRAAIAETPVHAPRVPTEEASPPLAPSSGDPVEANTEPEPVSQRASREDVAQWASRVRSSGLGSGPKTEPSTASAWPLVLNDLMGVVGVPRDLSTTVGVIEEIEGLDAVATPERQEAWARLPKHAQQCWLSMLVARTRALKELPSAELELKGRVKTIIGRYPAWAKEHMPGHVNGMKVTHEPKRGSWTEDAQEAWSALAGLVGEEPLPNRASAPTRKPKRVRHDDGDEEPALDSAWPVLPLVRAQRAIIVGGDPREPNRERLERAFQLASLEWPPIEGPRKVDAIAERIRRRTYGLVLVLQPFIAHKQSDAIIGAAKNTKTHWALVEGYGVAAVKLGLERFLHATESGVSLPDGPADPDHGRPSVGRP